MTGSFFCAGLFEERLLFAGFADSGVYLAA
jgi:hypothetical protein